jgi:AcrR family transcriptional regulator
MHSQEEFDPRALRLMWGKAAAVTRGPRARFTLDDVARAGITLADRLGLGGVTISTVAAELELTTTAIYRYVDSKDSLIEVMVDIAVGPPPALVASAVWHRQVRTWTAGLWRAYLAHPWLCDVKPTGMPRYPNGLHWIDNLLTILDQSPLTDSMNLLLLLNVMVRGYASLHQTVSPAEHFIPAWMPASIAERFPRLARELGRDPGGIEKAFWGAFDRLITPLIDAQPAGKKARKRKPK